MLGVLRHQQRRDVPDNDIRRRTQDVLGAVSAANGAVIGLGAVAAVDGDLHPEMVPDLL